MDTDEIDILVNEAHAIFGATSVYEVIYRENKEAYDNPNSDNIDRYLKVTGRLKKVTI